MYNPGPLGMTSAYPPTFTQYNQQPLFNQISKIEVIRVHGEEGAKAYQMPPNSSVLLLDETAPIVWLKTTDGASYPTITGYNITPIEPPPMIAANEDAYKSLEERIEKLERMLNNGKSNTSKASQSKSASTTD